MSCMRCAACIIKPDWWSARDRYTSSISMNHADFIGVAIIVARLLQSGGVYPCFKLSASVLMLRN
jgi:hypothetical protein